MTEPPHASPTRTRWSVLLPLSGSALLASATGGISGDLFNLFLTGELGFSPAVLSVIYAGMLLSLPLQLAGPTIAQCFRFHTLMTAGAVVNAAAVVAILLVVHLPVGDRLQLTVVIVAAVAVEIAFSPSYGTVSSAWLGEVVRDEDRPTVLSLGKLLS